MRLCSVRRAPGVELAYQQEKARFSPKAVGSVLPGSAHEDTLTPAWGPVELRAAQCCAMRPGVALGFSSSP